MPLLPRRAAAVLTVAAACLLAGVYAEKHATSIASMSVAEIEHQLQVSIKLASPKLWLLADNPNTGMPISPRSQCL